MKYLLLTLLLASQAFGYPKNSPSNGLNSAGVSAFGNPEYRDEMVELASRYVQVEITSANIKTLNTTPLLAVTSPGAGKVLIPIAVYGTLDYNSAAYAANSDKTLDVEYGGSKSGEKVLSLPYTFVEATADKASFAPVSAGISPLENTALYVHMDAGNATLGDGTIFLRIYYKIAPYLLN